jgi:triphosphatase
MEIRQTPSAIPRVRHNGEKFLQTVKSVGSNGTFKRGEWEHKIKGDLPDLRKTHGTPLAPLLSNKLKRRLKPIFQTRVHRITVPVRRNGSHIEVALDAGEVRAGRKSNPISELELELKRGKAGDLFFHGNVGNRRGRCTFPAPTGRENP